MCVCACVHVCVCVFVVLEHGPALSSHFVFLAPHPPHLLLLSLLFGRPVRIAKSRTNLDFIVGDECFVCRVVQRQHIPVVEQLSATHATAVSKPKCKHTCTHTCTHTHMHTRVQPVMASNLRPRVEEPCENIKLKPRNVVVLRNVLCKHTMV